jgi:hypothetical protein
MSKPLTRAERYGNIPARLRAKNHFIVERWGKGWAVTIKRRGRLSETILLDTPGQVNQLRQKLSVRTADLLGAAE